VSTVQHDETPTWFTRAIGQRPASNVIEVAGTDIHYLTWGHVGQPGLVFVHGGAAHAQWWSFLAPFFASEWRIAALDLSGHGDSGRREQYSHTQWADEVMAVAEAAGITEPPIIVGHSLGGMVTIQVGHEYGDNIAGVVIVDSPVRRPDPESEAGSTGRTFRSPGTYPDLETAMKRFRLIPHQPCSNTYIIEHIARNSLVETEAGWTWKFDPRVFVRTIVGLRDQLAAIETRIALIRGDLSVVVPPDTAAYMYQLMGGRAPVISIPEAHHHLILDQPLAFVSSLRTLLADWGHSVPI
jgi:pimeloyl-ACP methyl ester carboxylesterase